MTFTSRGLSVAKPRYDTTIFSGLILLIVVLFSLSGQAAPMLPELGSGEGSLVNLTHDKSIAEQVLRNLRHDDLILDDPLLSEYIQNLGNRIASQANWKRGSFHFFLIKDMDINAFALPAGYIGINAGLFLRSQSEDELAAVLAHEISHVTQRHHNRASEYIEKQNVFLAAAIIAAIASGGNDSGASMAILMGSMANNLHANLAYSRNNEQEADRVGIELLYRANFDGQGMVQFFDKLHQSQRFNDGEYTKYLRSHPVTLERLSDARNRLKQASTQKKYHTSDYLLMWQRLAHLTEAPDGIFTEPPQTHLSKLYKQSLKLEQSEEYGKILELLQPVLKGQADSIPLSIYIADTYQKTGQNLQSLKLYQQLHELYPTQTSITLGYCKQLLHNKQTRQAKVLLRKAIRQQQPVMPELYKLLARIETQRGASASAYRYLSTYYFETGRPHQALQQLAQGLDTPGLSFYEREELEAQQTMVREHIQMLESLPGQ
ncbi:MAG: M48 family metalloprotease [Gammaproteobacteria bacterium]|nr:M48 family metalloprotease [Gammaproteobacteria bacterium]